MEEPTTPATPAAMGDEPTVAPVLDPNTRALTLAVLLSASFAKWEKCDDSTLARAAEVVDRIEQWALQLPISSYVPPVLPPAVPGATASSISLHAPPPETGMSLVPHPVAMAPATGTHGAAMPMANTVAQNPGNAPINPSMPGPAGHPSTPVLQPAPGRPPRFPPAQNPSQQ